MKKRLAVAVALAAVVTMMSAPNQAMAGANDNNSATISGVTPVAATGDLARDCPSEYFCMYTGSYLTGKVFRMRSCTTRAVYNWNGVGSYYNHNIPNIYGYAKLKDYYKNVVTNISPKGYYGDTRGTPYNYTYNFSPIWYVTPCEA
jgi:hypothetical protein